MPKASRQKKARLGRSAPTNGAPSNKAEEIAAIPIVDKLKSPTSSSADKIWACAGLSNLIISGDKTVIRTLGAQKLVNALIARSSTTTENDLEVRIEACGTLRNLAVQGGPETIKEIFNKGFTPILLSHIPQILSTLLPDQHTSSLKEQERSDARPIVWDWADNVVTLIWSFAEAATKSLPILSTNDSLAPFLMTLLSISLDNTIQAPLTIALATLHTLSVLTDANPQFSLPLLSSDLSTLLDLIKQTPLATKSSKKDNQKHLLGVLAVSVLLNVCSCAFVPLPGQPSQPTKESSALQARQRQSRLLAKQVKEELDASSLKILLNALAAYEKSRASEPSSEAEEERLQDLQATLEVVAEVCNSLDGLKVEDTNGDDDWQGIESDDEDAEMAVDDTSEAENAIENEGDDIEIEMFDGEDDEEETTEIASSTRSLLLSQDLIGTLLRIGGNASELTTNDVSTSNGGPTIISPIATIQSTTRLRAVEALNNLLFTIARLPKAATFLPTESRQNTWNRLFALAQQLHTSNTLDANRPLALKATLGGLWALAKACLQESDAALAVGSGETPFLVGLLQQTSASTASSEQEEVCVRCIGILGSLGMRVNVGVAENQTIGNALIAPFRHLAADGTASISHPILVQALDSIFDVYADENREYDVPVFRQQDFLQSLEKSVTVWTKMTKSVDGRKYAELRSRMDGALTNLKAFIAYRKAL